MSKPRSLWFKQHAALIVWCVCTFALIGPPLLAWAVRGIAYAAACTPGPEPCSSLPLGEALRATLTMSWAFSSSLVVLVVLSLIATLAAFCERKPLFGTLSFFLLPLIALALPMLAVYVSRYDGCDINPDGVGSCVLWGVRMGMSFHTAATVQDKLYDLMPQLAGLTVMLGLLGWFFAHPTRRRRARVGTKTTMQMRQFTNPPPEP
jgi:hypothetical protein